MRRPSRRDTASTSRRAASRRPSLTPTARATPVGARYSPNTPRSVSVHSPVVMPAAAQAIEAGVARVYTPKDFDLTQIMRDIVVVVDQAWKKAA